MAVVEGSTVASWGWGGTGQGVGRKEGVVGSTVWKVGEKRWQQQAVVAGKVHRWGMEAA